jgi:hypothetical protein
MTRLQRTRSRLTVSLLSVLAVLVPGLASAPAAHADSLLRIDVAIVDGKLQVGYNVYVNLYRTAHTSVRLVAGSTAPAAGTGQLIGESDEVFGQVNYGPFSTAHPWAVRVDSVVDGVTYTATRVLVPSKTRAHYDPHAKSYNTSVHVVLLDGARAPAKGVSFRCTTRITHRTWTEADAMTKAGKLTRNTENGEPSHCVATYMGFWADYTDAPDVPSVMPSSAKFDVNVPITFSARSLENLVVPAGRTVTWNLLVSPVASSRFPVQVQLASHGRWRTVRTVRAGKPDALGEAPFAFALLVPDRPGSTFAIRLLAGGKNGYLASTQVSESIIARG